MENKIKGEKFSSLKLSTNNDFIYTFYQVSGLLPLAQNNELNFSPYVIFRSWGE
jgi:hypothetical protein